MLTDVEPPPPPSVLKYQETKPDLHTGSFRAKKTPSKERFVLSGRTTDRKFNLPTTKTSMTVFAVHRVDKRRLLTCGCAVSRSPCSFLGQLQWADTPANGVDCADTQTRVPNCQRTDVIDGARRETLEQVGGCGLATTRRQISCDENFRRIRSRRNSGATFRLKRRYAGAVGRNQPNLKPKKIIAIFLSATQQKTKLIQRDNLQCNPVDVKIKIRKNDAEINILGNGRKSD